MSESWSSSLLFQQLAWFCVSGLHFLNAGKTLLCPTHLRGFCGNQERKPYFKRHTTWNKAWRENTGFISLRNITKNNRKGTFFFFLVKLPKSGENKGQQQQKLDRKPAVKRHLGHKWVHACQKTINWKLKKFKGWFKMSLDIELGWKKLLFPKSQAWGKK